jgi:anhydro-N-acetylmuramic acid kinase
MVYKAIVLMSGSSLDGLDIAYVYLQETAGKWSFEMVRTAWYVYPSDWRNRLASVGKLGALQFQQLHADYGHYLGREVNRFISENELDHQVALVSSHGHTAFHFPGTLLTSQLGEGAAIAAETSLPVVSDLRSLDIALGGQGAPIVPMGEKLLFGEYELLLNLGGIANISFASGDSYIAFDICSANAILNFLAHAAGKEYDDGGKMALSGELNKALLDELNALDYYSHAYPKSLDNSFGVENVLPVIEKYGLPVVDSLRTYAEHIALQVLLAVQRLKSGLSFSSPSSMLVTGGGVFNDFLIARMRTLLLQEDVTIDIPSPEVVKFKEALIMALLGVLRWRETYTVLSSVTGARRNSIGGALWLGTDA